MSERQNIPCPVCGSNTFRVLFKPRKIIDDPKLLYGAASGLPGVQTVVECRHCEMVYENPRFSEASIIEGYAASNDAGHDSQHRMRVDSFYRALTNLRRRLPPSGSKVLDVGTAGGAFLDAAKRFGYDATGVEPSRYLVEACSARGLKAIQGTIDSFESAAASFDLVTLWDVIEHLARPKDALLRIHELLKPGGTLLINYPDVGTWQAKLAGSRFWWYLSVHLSYFTPRTMRRICESAGFKVTYIKPYWQTLRFGYLQQMAIHYRIPMAKLFHKLTPEFIRRIPVRYYASQTTLLATKA